MPAPTHVILLALAGAAGTLLRAGCTAVAIRLVGVGFPWGTLAVNVAGSFAFGVLAGLARSRGLLGGFTTYSSFAFQTVELLAAGRPVAAAAYVLATNAAALAAVWAGLRLGGA